MKLLQIVAIIIAIITRSQSHAAILNSKEEAYNQVDWISQKQSENSCKMLPQILVNDSEDIISIGKVSSSLEKDGMTDCIKFSNACEKWGRDKDPHPSSTSKRVFITGIAGFIGFHTALTLKKAGLFVAGCDNFNDYYDVSLKKDRKEILENAGIEVFPLSIQEIDELSTFFEDEKITHIIHLAAQAGVRHSTEHPDLFTQDNLLGFMSILEFCKKHAPLKLVYASSSSVYGIRNDNGFSETENTDHPISFYAATKKTNEILAYSYHYCFNLDAVGLRFFTVYGPWGRPDMAIGLFVNNINHDIPITLFEPEKMERDFTYIDDIVSGIQASLDLKGYHVINLGNSKKHKLIDLVRLIENALGKKAKINLQKAPTGDVYKTSADISLAKKLLGYSPKTDLPEGIKAYVAWYLAHISQK
jgi:UDP-glucuronate 4-epimerase